MAAALRCAARRLLIGGGGFQRTPAVAAEEGQRRLSPRFNHSGPSPSYRRFSSYQHGDADRPRKVALWKRGGHLLLRTTYAVSMFVASYYILKFSVSEILEPGYMVREAASLVKKTQDKYALRWFQLGSFQDG